MNAAASPALSGRVASLHLHPPQPGAQLSAVDQVDLVEAKGVARDERYFGRISRDTGKPTRRQVTLIEREQIAEHAAALGLPQIPPGAVRSNIETSGISLTPMLGKEIEIGEAVLYVHSHRDPCEKMDAICRGLREKMMDGKQGVIAEVRRGGKVRVGDTIRIKA